MTFEVVAYPDEDNKPKKSAFVEAECYEDAETEAWNMFPEYHEIGVYPLD